MTQRAYKYIFHIAATILFALSLTACEGDGEQAQKLDAWFQKNHSPSIEIPALSSGAFLCVDSDQAWTVSVEYTGTQSDWCTPGEPMPNGVVWLFLNANTSTDARSANVKVTSGSQTVTLSLTQSGAPMPPDPDTTLEAWIEEGSQFEWNATSATVSIICTAQWTLSVTYTGSSTGWCTPASGSGEGNRSFALTLGQNTAATSRSAVITVSSEGHVEQLTLTQIGKTDVTLDASLAVSYIAATATSATLNIASNSDWTVSFTYPSGTAAWCSTTTASGTGNKAVTITTGGNTSQSARTATVTISAPPRTVELTLSQYGQGITPANDRYELAATGDGMFLEYTAGKFAMEYSTEKRHPKWVAWKLVASNFGSSGRTNAWQQDSRIPSQYRATDADFYSPYNRGHMCPSGERTESKAMNGETFFYSNMSPQRIDMNGGVWLQLENFERAWAQAGDELWICCGAPLHREDWIIGYTSAHQMAIPRYNFKVILRKPKGSSTYMALGFWFYNDKSYGGTNKATFISNFSNIIKSVDDIEEMTGYDFFYLLPKDIQDQVEASKSTTGWGLN